MPPTWPSQVAHLLKLQTIYLEVRMWRFSTCAKPYHFINKVPEGAMLKLSTLLTE